MRSVQRIRIEYSKKGPLRYIGHLDLMHTFLRALRRAGLPVTYTEGFNPRIKCSFSPALPLGFESEGEFIELYLERRVDVSWAKQVLQSNLPDGITIKNIKILPLFGKITSAQVKGVSYTIDLGDLIGREELERKIRDFRENPEAFYLERKGKRVNITALISKLEMGSNGKLWMEIKTENESNLNPKTLIKEVLGMKEEDLVSARFTRQKFLF